jgi:hypothetical protein
MSSAKITMIFGLAPFPEAKNKSKPIELAKQVRNEK